MKSKINFLLTLFAGQISFAQTPVLGIKLGIAISNASIAQANPDPSFDYNTTSKTGFLGGIYSDVHVGKDFIFRPGAEIVFKGFKQTNGGPYYYDYKTKFTYIDIPLNLIYKKKSDKGHLLAGGGPVIGFPINRSYSNYLVTSEFSINGLVGYEVPIGFSLNLNYTYGISNASKNKQYASKISNHYLGISAGYSF